MCLLQIFRSQAGFTQADVCCLLNLRIHVREGTASGRTCFILQLVIFLLNSKCLMFGILTLDKDISIQCINEDRQQCLFLKKQRSSVSPKWHRCVLLLVFRSIGLACDTEALPSLSCHRKHERIVFCHKRSDHSFSQLKGIVP